MHTRVAYALVAVTGLTTSWQAVAQAPTDSAHADSVATAAVGPTSATPLSMPKEVRGYRITDSIPLGPRGTQYTYVHDKNDKIVVLVGQYPKTQPLVTAQDTEAITQQSVDNLRQSMDEAFKRGDLTAFQSMRERSDDFKTSGRTVRGFVWLGALTHRGGGTAQINDPMSCSPSEMAR